MQAPTIGGARPAHVVLALTTAAVGPVVISILYLIVASLLRDWTGATGYARARLDIGTYAAYAIALAAFVIVGTWRCRGDLVRVLFALAAIVACLLNMFVAFFSQMAP